MRPQRPLCLAERRARRPLRRACCCVPLLTEGDNMPELAVDLRKQPRFTHDQLEPIQDARGDCHRLDWPLPSIFLLGAAKCGTTTLSTLLENLPDVCFSVSKEPWFFEVEYERGLDYYRQR